MASYYSPFITFLNHADPLALAFQNTLSHVLVDLNNARKAKCALALSIRADCFHCKLCFFYNYCPKLDLTIHGLRRKTFKTGEEWNHGTVFSMLDVSSWTLLQDCNMISLLVLRFSHKKFKPRRDTVPCQSAEIWFKVWFLIKDTNHWALGSNSFASSQSYIANPVAR